MAKNTSETSPVAVLANMTDAGTVDMSENDENGQIGHNMPDIVATYAPSVKTNADLAKEAERVEAVLVNTGNTVALNVTSTLATYAADMLCMGCEELRGRIGGLEKLQGEHRFYLEGMKAENAANPDRIIDVYGQLRPAVVESLGKEVMDDATVKSLLPNALKKAVLLALGYAQFAWFERSKGGRITAQTKGIPMVGADGKPTFPEVDETKFARGIAVTSKVMGPVMFDTVQLPQKQGGGIQRKEPQGFGWPKPNSDETLFYLSNEVAAGLYAKHVLKLPEDRIAYDPFGFIEGIAAAKRQTSGTQAEGNGTTATGTTTLIKMPEPAEIAAKITKDGIFSGKDDTLTGAVLRGMFNAAKNENSQIDVDAYWQVFIGAIEMAQSFSERFPSADVILKHPKGLETVEALADLGKLITQQVARWTPGDTKVEFLPSGKTWKDGAIAFDFSKAHGEEVKKAGGKK